MVTQQNGTVRIRSNPTHVSLGKQIIYRFNGDPKDDEIISDRFGTMPLRRIGEVLEKNGKRWRVDVIRDDFDLSASKRAVAIHRVFLTDRA